MVVADVTRDGFLRFRGFWIDRIAEEGLFNDTANKDFDKMTNVLNAVIGGTGLELVLPIPKRNWRWPMGEVVSPPPFSESWISETLLSPGALDGLNDEARAIFLICMNTGARPSGIATLKAERIKLDTNIPYVQIHADGRKLKTKNPKRDPPLLGIGLEAARAHPEGFPRYRDIPSSLPGALLK